MASTPTLTASGTQTATINTEHSLLSQTTAGTFVLEVDTNALANGDILELRIKKIVLVSGTERVCYIEIYYDAQDTDDLIKTSLPVPVDTGIQTEFTLKQTAGTGRAFPWKVLAL